MIKIDDFIQTLNLEVLSPTTRTVTRVPWFTSDSSEARSFSIPLKIFICCMISLVRKRF